MSPTTDTPERALLRDIREWLTKVERPPIDVDDVLRDIDSVLAAGGGTGEREPS